MSEESKAMLEKVFRVYYTISNIIDNKDHYYLGEDGDEFYAMVCELETLLNVNFDYIY